MALPNLKSLVGRLAEAAKGALESAAGLCVSKTHYQVEIEHWLWKLLEIRGGQPATATRQVAHVRDQLVEQLAQRKIAAPVLVRLASQDM